MFAAALVIITTLIILWAGPAASAGVFAAQSRASQSPAPAHVKYYIVPAATSGSAESLSMIAEKTLGDASRFMEIFDLNKGRLQPNGGRLESPREIFPGWVLQLPADASGPGVHFGPLPVTSPRLTSPAPHRPSRPSRPSAGGAPAPHSSIGWAGIGVALVGVLGLAGLTVGLIRRRRAGGAVRRGPSHARPPGPAPSARAGAAARTAPATQLADPPWPAADYPSQPGSAPPWPAGGPRWTSDHPSMPGSAPPWPAVGPPGPAADQLSRRRGSDQGWPAGGPHRSADHPSWPAGSPIWPRADGRAAAPRRGSPPELHHDRRSRAASASGISLTRNPVGNWGPAGALAASPADRTQWRSAQSAPAAANQAQYEAAPGDGDQVVLTKAPPARPDRETAWDARGGMLQLTADNATELASPVALETAGRPNADSVRLAGRILSVADDRAAEIMQQASDRAAEITQQASGQAAAIRTAAEQEAAEITRQASGQAAAIRAAAEQEAAELRASLMTMSAELSRVATYVTDNLAAPARPAIRPAERPVTQPSDRPAFQPVTRPVTRPSDRPAFQPVTRPVTKPSDYPAAQPAARPATTPAVQPRQHAAMRLTRLITAALVLFAAVCGTTEIALHGFRFFVFRSAGTGSTPGNGLQEDQGPGQPNTPGTHHHHHVTGHKP